MNQRSHLSIVQSEDLPPPLLPHGIDLEDLPSYMIDVDWVTNPRFWARVPRDAKMAAVELQVASTLETPAGSLPADEEGLALASGLLSDLEGWRRVATYALRGWTLCSDGRYYRPDVAKKVLRSWIVRLADRRRGAAGLAKRRKEEFDARQYDADLAVAVACMTRLDPYAPILRNYRNAQPDIDGAQSDADAASANAPSNASDKCKVSEAKRSQANLSPDLRSGDSPDRAEAEGLEFEKGEGGKPEALPPVAPKEHEPPERWPKDALDQLKVIYPRKVAWGDAEKALEKIRKGGKTPFSVVMLGVRRYAATQPNPEFTPYPATWLNRRGWEDEPDVRPVVFGKAEILSPIRGSPGPSITRRAVVRAAQRMGIYDEHHLDV